MKHLYSNILVFFLAAIVFFVGAGATIVNFCCDNCMSSMSSIMDCNDTNQYIKNTVEANFDACCSEKSSSNKIVSTDDCSSHHQEKNSCSVERVSTDIDHFFSKPTINSPFTWFATLFFVDIFSLDSKKSLTSDDNEIHRVPIPISPREYLSFIRILII